MVKVLLQGYDSGERVFLELTEDQFRLLKYLDVNCWLLGGKAEVIVLEDEPDFKTI